MSRPDYEDAIAGGVDDDEFNELNDLDLQDSPQGYTLGYN